MIKIIVYLSALLAAVLVGCTSKTTDKNNNASNDSIQKYIALASNVSLDKTTRIHYNDKAYRLASKLKNTKESRNLLSDIVFQYYNFDIKDGFNNSSKVLLKNSLASLDSLNLGKAYRCRAFYYKNENILDSSFIYFSKSEKLYFKIDDQKKEELANIYLNKGIVEYMATDFLGAELSLTKAYSIYKNSDNKNNLYGTLNQLGLTYNELKEYDKSIFYHTKALETVRKYNLQDEQHQEAVCYNNIGYLYIKQKKYKEAIASFEEGLKDKQILKDDPDLYSLLIDNIAYSRLQSSNYNELPKLFFDALAIRLKINDPSIIVGSYIHISEYYQNKGDIRLSIAYSQKAITYSKQSKIPGNIVLALKQASIVDKNKSTIYSEEFIKISDSLQIEERKSKDRFTRIALETDEISQEKETAIKQKWIITGIALAVLVILFLLFIIFLQRSRQKELQFLRSQEKANEEIYQLMLAQKSKEEAAKQAEKKRISLELHDGIMNKLASTRLNLAVLSHNREDATITKCLTHITDIYQIEQEIRTIAHDLNKEVFQKSNSYTELLQDFVSDQNKNATTHYELEVEEAIDWTAISSEIKMNLYRIIQEACHNINKHAAAKKAIISIILDLPNICLSICDDGIGFDTSKKADGIGIQNIQQRVKLLNGKFSMYSNPHTATSINVAIPI
ncbi:tetratricopeptide repeat protein [Flavobacterium sp.]|jgi:signal transduction histidine kinase|uniref:tetratricopeptide repeat-containing sensor histidine kinase n=1 Tax=Flavobacterium sp. TaxID=239 RepID=UPI0037C069A1